LLIAQQLIEIRLLLCRWLDQYEHVIQRQVGRSRTAIELRLCQPVYRSRHCVQSRSIDRNADSIGSRGERS